MPFLGISPIIQTLLISLTSGMLVSRSICIKEWIWYIYLVYVIILKLIYICFNIFNVWVTQLPSWGNLRPRKLFLRAASPCLSSGGERLSVSTSASYTQPLNAPVATMFSHLQCTYSSFLDTNSLALIMSTFVVLFWYTISYIIVGTILHTITSNTAHYQHLHVAGKERAI